MGNGKRVDGEVSDLEAFSSLDGFHRREFDPRRQHGLRLGRNVNRDTELVCQAGQAADVIRVFVGNQNSLQSFRLLSDTGQPPRRFPRAESGVDQELDPLCRQEGAVAGTAASQHGHANTDGSSCEFPKDSRTTPRGGRSVTPSAKLLGATPRCSPSLTGQHFPADLESVQPAENGKSYVVGPEKLPGDLS